MAFERGGTMGWGGMFRATAIWPITEATMQKSKALKPILVFGLLALLSPFRLAMADDPVVVDKAFWESVKKDGTYDTAMGHMHDVAVVNTIMDECLKNYAASFKLDLDRDRVAEDKAYTYCSCFADYLQGDKIWLNDLARLTILNILMGDGKKFENTSFDRAANFYSDKVALGKSRGYAHCSRLLLKK